MKSRTHVYVDGFNLYYGAIRGTAYKWLDLERFFRMLRNADDVRRIHYFTAYVDGPNWANQKTYLRALETSPLVHIVLGKFKMTDVRCRVSACTFAGERTFHAPVEKRTDVNIAVQLLQDAFDDACDTFVLVSGDSDLVPAVATVKERFPKKRVVVYVPFRNPKRGAAVELRSVADKDHWLPLNLLKLAQFPARVPDGTGGFIQKPASW